MTKKKLKTKATYQKAQEILTAAIVEVRELYLDAKKNGDKIALWGLAFVDEDLIKSQVRLGNLKLTTKGLK